MKQFTSAEELLRYLLEHATWYSSCLELDFKAEDGEDLEQEALRLLGQSTAQEDTQLAESGLTDYSMGLSKIDADGEKRRGKK
jgi:hypothetical protein